MSVVNDMLRDLDRRGAGENLRIFAQHVRPVDKRRHGPWRPVPLVAVALVAAAFAAHPSLSRSRAPASFESPVPLEGLAPMPSTESTQVRSAAPPDLPKVKTERTKPVTVKKQTSARTASAPRAKTAARSMTTARVGIARVATARDTALAPTASATPAVTLAAAPSAASAVAAPMVASAARPMGMSPAAPAAKSAAATTPTSAAAAVPTFVAGAVPASTSGAARTSAAAAAAMAAAAEPVPEALPQGSSRIDKKELAAPRQTAEAEFKRAVALLNQGRIEESRAALRAALTLDPRHAAARQTLAALLIESRGFDEAESVLAEGLRLDPGQANFAIVLARLKLDRGDSTGAHVVLRDHGTAQAGNAEYRAFHATVLRRLSRNSEAIVEYQAALKVAPGTGVWWLGLGLAQEAAERPDEAAEAFRRARSSGTLSPNLVAFVEQRLKSAP